MVTLEEEKITSLCCMIPNQIATFAIRHLKDRNSTFNPYYTTLLE